MLSIVDVPQQPDVILDVRFEEGLLLLSVKNIGSKPAINVSVRFKKRLVGIDGTKIVSALPLFRNIAFLAPQKEIETFLDTSASYFKRRQPSQIEATIRYKDVSGARFEAFVSHDLAIYKEIGYVRRAQPDRDGFRSTTGSPFSR